VLPYAYEKKIMPTIEELTINTIRFLAIDATNAAKSGHPGLPMGAAPMAYSLWTNYLRHNPRNPKWFNRDRFVLSAGHGSMLLYALLHLTGYEGVTLDEIKNFRQWGSKTPGHPENFMTPGVEVTTGPLGQGVGNGVGMAIAERYLAARFNRPDHEIINHYTYAIVSDGDLMEGVASEAASLAGHLKLGKLIYLYDANQVTIDGSTDMSFSEDVALRFMAYGWHVIPVDGMDIHAVKGAIATAQEDPRPSLIVARTVIGYGSPNRQGTSKAHGEPLGDEEGKLTRDALNWVDEKFFIPGEVLEHTRSAVDKGAQWEAEWNRAFDAYRDAYADLSADLERMIAGDLPDGWDADLPVYDVGSKADATRNYSGKALNAIAPKLPELLGGSADLAGSNKTTISNEEPFQSTSYHGRNMFFGVREHAMGAAMNGMYLHGGIIPYGGTFLIFTDYMRPSMRLAALSHVHAIYVMTHDSIGLGEDGPTHQSIEQLSGLRAIPYMEVIRPADGNETSAAWRFAIQHHSPVTLALTRQSVPVLEGTKEKAMEGVERGGYVLSDCDGTPDVILMGSGSEVQHCVTAQATLAEEGIKARVVSMPNPTRFTKQDADYQESVLPNAVRARLAIEAAAPQSWYQLVGLDGDVIGMEQFGASAPWETLMQEFGFTGENVVEQAKKLVK
jgi:transketolase